MLFIGSFTDEVLIAVTGMSAEKHELWGNLSYYSDCSIPEFLPCIFALEGRKWGNELCFLHQDCVIGNSLLHYELSRCVSSMRCDLEWLWGFLQLILSICERFISPIMSWARFFLQTVSPFLWSVLVPQSHETRTW